MWLTIALVGGAFLTARLFLWPPTHGVGAADAVVVLSGDFGDRLSKGLELMHAGVAPTLVLDGEPDYAAVEELCQSQSTFEVVCLRPEPDSTRAEARAAATLAADRHWDHMIVVTNRTHATRAGLLFNRCTDARVTMVVSHGPREPRLPLMAIGHEWPALVRAVVEPGC